METSRRAYLAAGATGGLALTAGCLDFVLGGGPLELEAERVAPSDATLAETGYEEYEVEQQRLDERIDVVVEREVRASIWSSIYSKGVEHGGHEFEGGFFAAISIPDFSVLGYSLNPIANMDNEELLEEFLEGLDGDYGSIDGVTHQESFGLEILGEGREVDVFEAEADLEIDADTGDDLVEVEIPVTSFGHDDDVLVLLGTHPAPLAAESANAELLMESVDHPV